MKPNPTDPRTRAREIVNAPGLLPSATRWEQAKALLLALADQPTPDERVVKWQAAARRLGEELQAMRDWHLLPPADFLAKYEGLTIQELIKLAEQTLATTEIELERDQE